MSVDVTELIKQAIANTAVLRNDASIASARDMIPHMRTILKDEEYPKNYIEDVQYAKSSAAKMDIYFPDNMTGKCPVFVEIHGGAWYFGQKSSIEFKPFLHGLERGYICVSLDYTLAPDCVYPQSIVEVKQAIDYLKKNADKYNIDPDRIALWGGSAGAHMAALAAYSADTGYLKEESEDADSSVNVLVLWYGCHNYYLGKRLDEWIYHNFYGTEDLSEVKENVLLSNPAVHVTKNAPYTYLQHGLIDAVVPYEQSVYLYNVIKSIAGEDKCKLDLLENCDHADIKMFAPYNVRQMFDYIDSKINQKEV